MPGEADAVPGAPGVTSSSEKHHAPLPTRSSDYQKLKAYEANRSLTFGKTAESSTLYWRSFRSLLQDSVSETHRFLEMMEARCHSDRAYADSLAACAEGRVDNDNRPIPSTASKTKQKKDAKRRDEDKFRLNSETGLLESRTQSDIGMLAGLISGHADVAARYEENVAFVENDILPPLREALEKLEGDVAVIEALGDSLVLEVTAAEEKVKDSYRDYEECATKCLAGGGSEDEIDRVISPGMNGTKTESGLIEDSYCVWVREMRYVLGVVLLQRCWRKCNDELSGLFKKMKDIEYNRRIRLRELLVLFMQRQEQLWLSLPALTSPALKALQEREIDREKIDEDVGKAIRIGAQNIQIKDNSRAIQRSLSLAEQVNTEAKPETAPAAEAALPDLDSPLTSSLLGRAKVIERKKDGLMGGWRPVLAVVTADNFLHLFDVPPALKASRGAAPEVAFQHLIPPVDVPTHEDFDRDVRKGRKAPSSTGDVKRDWHGIVAPAESYVLPNCKIEYAPRVGDDVFEIAETVFNTGASKVFSRTSTRKVTLRSVNQQECVDWIVSLKSQR